MKGRLVSEAHGKGAAHVQGCSKGRPRHDSVDRHLFASVIQIACCQSTSFAAPSPNLCYSRQPLTRPVQQLPPCSTLATGGQAERLVLMLRVQ